MVRRTLVLVLLLVAACSSKKKASNDTPGSGSAPGSGTAAQSTAKIVGEWNVVAAAGQCTANDLAPCPDATCDQPPPRAIECPPGIAEVGNARVVELDDKTCVIAPADCKGGACLGAKTPCPLPRGETFPALSWAVTALSDGTCFATSSNAIGTKSITIKCPAADVTGMMITRPKADAPCSAGVGAKTAPTPCPVEPKQFTVVTLREAITKDAAQFVDQRVKVQGFYVKSMVGQVAKGKETTYRLGAADTKGDAKTAVVCESTIPLPEAADGDAIVVEGTPKKGGAPNEVSLAQCHASAP